MTIELRSLRISAELDATKYVAPAQQKVAADKAMAASGKEAAAGITAVGGASQSTETKVSATVNVMERLSRQFVDGYGTAQRATAAINALSREIDKTGFDAARVSPILDGIYRKYGQLADASVFAARGQVQLAAAITETTARLATQEAVISRRGGRVPIIPREQEFQSPWGQATPPQAGQRLVAANNNVSSFNTANIAAQFQDIAVTSAMGMNPLQIALQQGTQLSMVFEQMKGNGQSAGAALLGAFSSVISPLSLLTIGAVAATAAAVQYFSTWAEGGKTLDDVLEAHEKRIRQIGDAYGYAAQQQKAGGLFSGRGADLLSATSANELRLGIQREASSIVASNIMPVGWPFAVEDAIAPDLEPFEEALRSLQATAKAGNPEIAEFRRLVTERWSLDPLNKDLTTTAGNLLDVSNSAAAAEAALAELERMRLARVDAYRQYGMSREAGPESKTAADDLKRRLDSESDAAMRADMRARTFSERMNAVRMAAAVGDPIGRGDRVRVAVLEEQIRQEVELRDATRSRADAQRQAEEQATLERMTIGKTVGEIERLNVAAREYQSIREQSERTGIPISDADLQRVKEFAKAMGDAADATARLQLQNDLAFERSQLFRTPGEQAIASRLRDTGMSLDGPEAQQMRDNQRFAEAKELVTGFATDFKEALLDNGGDIGDAFAQSILNAASKAMDKAWENIFDQLGNAVASWMTGVTPGAGAGGGAAGFVANTTASAFFGAAGGANDNYAPGAVTRAPLADVGSTAMGGLRYANEAATRNLALTDTLAAKVKDAVGAIYGEGAYASVYSGGQSAIGSGMPRVGSTRHDLGHAGDLRIFDAAGNQIKGDQLAPLAQYWQAKKLGGTGLEMRGGGIHLDEHTDRPSSWNYASQGGQFTAAQQAAVRSGQQGIMPEVASLANSTDKLSEALDGVTTSAVDAGKGLGSLFSGPTGVNSLGGDPWAGMRAPSGGGGGGLFGWLGSLFGGANLAGGAHGGFTGGSSSLVQSLRWANGGAFAGGNVIPFANGDVFDRPSYFPMSGGRTGMMGEAGPEAIMPLRRGADGRLGVAAAGGGANNNQPPPINDNRVFHIDARGAQQGVGAEIQAALAEYDKRQRRAGYGDTQRQFNAQKG